MRSARYGLAALTVFLAFHAGCGSKDDKECDVEDLVAREIDGLDAIECGIVDDLDGGVGQAQETLDCVQNAVDSGAPFYLVWRLPGFEGSTTNAYVGRSLDGSYEILQFSQSPDASGRYATSRSICSGLAPHLPCPIARLYSDFCFECLDESREVLCERN